MVFRSTRSSGEIAPESITSGTSLVGDIENRVISRKTVWFALVAALTTFVCITFIGSPVIAQAEELSSQATSSGIRISTEFNGADRYETAAEISQTAYPNGSSGVIIASGMDFPDALAATALAGTRDYPVLLTLAGGLPAATIDEIERLGATQAYVIGGTAVISTTVEGQIRTMGLDVTRIEGSNRFGTALGIADEIKDTSSKSKTLIISYGFNFADSASISPYSAKYNAPILLTDSSGNLPEVVSSWIAENGPLGSQRFDAIIITGGSSVVCDGAYALCVDYGYTVQRLAGTNRYETSQKIVEWSVNQAGMSYDQLGLANGLGFADALAGGVLQGKSNSVIQLVDASASALQQMHTTLMAADNTAGTLVSIRFFGGYSAISQVVREDVIGTRFTTYAISYTDALEYQYKKKPQIQKNGSWVDASKDEVSSYLNPASFSARDYQFLVLSKYSGVTGAGLNTFLANKMYMAGKGELFVSAAQAVGINEVYLTMHAGWETGWGRSELAQGVVIDGKTYYNFFGIGAYDDDPVGTGSQRAKTEGWDTPEKAILGGAAWIKAQYIGQGLDTLYKMRWNPEAMALGVWGKQYATDVAWAAKIALQMKTIYDATGTPSYLSYEVPAYL